MMMSPSSDEDGSIEARALSSRYADEEESPSSDEDGSIEAVTPATDVSATRKSPSSDEDGSIEALIAQPKLFHLPIVSVLR